MTATSFKTAGNLRVEPYCYTNEDYTNEDLAAASPLKLGFAEVDARGNPIRAEGIAKQDTASEKRFERRLAEEMRRSFEAGRQRGFADGRAAEREAQAAQSSADSMRRAERLAHLAESFAAQSEKYLAQAEQEVVKLSLAIAARILRREAQMDPLLLMGAVRVALGQLAASTDVRLRVSAADADLWTEAIALVPNRTLKIEVIGEKEMRLGDCIVETEFGSVDLGVRAQLSEIERGFFDRAASPSPAEPS